MNTAIVTGAAGFAGYSLVKQLVNQGVEVYAVVRPGSPHNDRLKDLTHIHIISLEINCLHLLPQRIDAPCDVFFHLAWAASNREDFRKQNQNIEHCIAAVEASAALSCKRILFTGSQAEYGVVKGVQTEDLAPNPITAYGAAKVAACYLTKCRAEQLGIDWIWARIFSLIGKYEPRGRMIPDLITALKNGNTPHLSSCTQYWDYLDAADAGEGAIALARHGKSGEIYNLAHGNYKPLRTFTETIHELVVPNTTIAPIQYGKQTQPYIELRPCIEKIFRDTGWRPAISFADTISHYI